jgi:hypothetical protein
MDSKGNETSVFELKKMIRMIKLFKEGIQKQVNEIQENMDKTAHEETETNK